MRRRGAVRGRSVMKRRSATGPCRSAPHAGDRVGRDERGVVDLLLRTPNHVKERRPVFRFASCLLEPRTLEPVAQPTAQPAGKTTAGRTVEDTGTPDGRLREARLVRRPYIVRVSVLGEDLPHARRIEKRMRTTRPAAGALTGRTDVAEYRPGRADFVRIARVSAHRVPCVTGPARRRRRRLHAPLRRLQQSVEVRQERGFARLRERGEPEGDPRDDHGERRRCMLDERGVRRRAFPPAHVASDHFPPHRGRLRVGAIRQALGGPALLAVHGARECRLSATPTPADSAGTRFDQADLAPT